MRLRTISFAAVLCMGGLAFAGEPAGKVGGASAMQTWRHPIRAFRMGRVEKRLAPIKGSIVRIEAGTQGFAEAQARVNRGEWSALNAPTYARRQAFFDGIYALDAAIPALEQVARYAATKKVGVAETQAVQQKLVLAAHAFMDQTKGFIARGPFADDPAMAVAYSAYGRLDTLAQSKK